MSINICPCCKGKSEILDNPKEDTEYICCGCEIELYDKLHEVMKKCNLSKEGAYKFLVGNYSRHNVN